jgi:hypothetical protein
MTIIAHLQDNPTPIEGSKELLSHKIFWREVDAVMASGDDLARCCYILGIAQIVASKHVFIGDRAKEIVVNW